MIDLEQLKRIIIVWSAAMGFSELGSLVNEEITLQSFLETTITNHQSLIQEREEQIRIQTERLGHDVTESTRRERENNISIIQKQKSALMRRVKFFQDISLEFKQ